MADAGEVANLLRRGAELRRRYLQTGDVDALTSSLHLANTALRMSPGSGEAHLDVAAALLIRYEAQGALDDLDQALQRLATAEELLPPGENRTTVYANTVGARTTRFYRLGDTTDLTAGIAAAERGIHELEATGTDSLALRTNLAGLLLLRYQVLGDPADLDYAISAGRGGLPGPFQLYAALAGNLLERFRRTHRAADLTEALEYSAVGVRGAPPGSPGRLLALAVAGAALRVHYERTGSLSSLTEAVQHQREAGGLLDDRHPQAGTLLLDFAHTYRLRFERHGVRADLDALTELLARAMRSPAPQIQVMALTCQAQALRSQAALLARDGDRPGSAQKAREAIVAAQDALDRSEPTDPRRPDRLINLANAYRQLFDAAGDPAADDAAAAHLTAAREAMAVSDQSRAVAEINLANHLIRTGKAAGDVDRVRRAVDLLESIVAANEQDGPVLALAILSLIAARTLTASATPDVIVALLRRLRGLNTAPPIAMVAAGILAGDWMMSLGSDQAAPAYGIAVTALPTAIWHGLDRATQEAHLIDITGIATAAASAYLRVGDERHALESLENARNVMWSRTLELRQPTYRLAKVRPDLASRLDEVAGALGTL